MTTVPTGEFNDGLLPWVILEEEPSHSRRCFDGKEHLVPSDGQQGEGPGRDPEERGREDGGLGGRVGQGEGDGIDPHREFRTINLQPVDLTSRDARVVGVVGAVCPPPPPT